MIISDWIQIIGAIITTFGILVATYFGISQIRISNKQVLFDKRLEVFMIADGFKQLIEEDKSILQTPKEFAVMNGFYFRSMVNNTYLNQLYEVLPELLNVEGVTPLDNPDTQRNFLIKKEEIFQKVQAAELIFEKPENLVISKFMYDYVKLLDGRRRYEIVLKQFQKDNKQYQLMNNKNNFSFNEYLEKYTKEKDYRQNLLIEPINSLSDSYKKYCKQQHKIKSQISLKRGRK